MSVAASLNPSIGIIGAGIGGLALSNALLRRGLTRVKVCDQAARFLPTVGAGFGFSPNGQICMASIGIDDGGTILHPFRRMARLDREGRLQRTSDVFRQVKEKYGFGFAGCLRADLVDILARPLKDGNQLHYSHNLSSIVEVGDKVHVTFDNGVEEEFDVVIGADGIHSTVAESLKIDPSPPVYSGANIFYGVIPDPDSVDFKHKALIPEEADHTVLQGPGTGEFISFRVGPDDRKCHIWANTYVSKDPPPKTEEWDVGGERARADLNRILNQFPDTHPIHELASFTPPDRLLHFGLYYRKHKNSWSRGRVCLLGDSCHATLPYVGQGANQAIEDAIVLADCLEKSYPNYQDAFQAYYEKRSRRTQRVVRLANFLDKLYHSQNPITNSFLNWFLNSIMKGGMIFKQIEREIVEECPVDYKAFQ